MGVRRKLQELLLSFTMGGAGTELKWPLVDTSTLTHRATEATQVQEHFQALFGCSLPVPAVLFSSQGPERWSGQWAGRLTNSMRNDLG